jgi:drug/metabolite transporter (DMT)-like permease
MDSHLVTVALALMAAVLLAANQVCGRIGLQYGTVPQSWLVVFCTSAVIMSLTAVVIAPQPWRMSVNGGLLFAADGLLYACAAGLMLVSGLKVGPSTASAVKNASPVPAILLAIPFLGELPGIGELLGTALCVSGVLLLSGRAGATGRDRFWRPVMVYPIAAMLFFAVDNVVRKAGIPQVSHPMLGAIAAGAAMTVFALTAFVVTRSRRPSPQAFKWFLLTGTFQGFAYFFIISALASGSVAVVVPLYTSSPIWVVLGSRLFLGHLETLTPRVVLGVLTVFAGIVVITVFGG